MCQSCKEKFYITTAIAYASKEPHIGNVYEAILSDAIAAQGVIGRDTVLEHGRAKRTRGKRP